MEILFGILGLIAIFIAVILIRTLAFKPLPQPKIFENNGNDVHVDAFIQDNLSK